MKLTNLMGACCLMLLLAACNSVDFKKTKGGMPYKLYASKNGTKIEAGNIVKVHMVGKVKDSVIFSTYTSAPQYLQVTPTGNPYDFSEVLPTMKQGDSLYTVQLIDTFMARNPQGVPPQFKKGDKLETTVRVLTVFKSEQEAQADMEKEMTASRARRDAESQAAFEKDTTIQNQLRKETAFLTDYLAKNNIAAQKTGKGTFVQILSPGQGLQADQGKYVSVMYKGSTLDGKVFDTNMDASKGHTDPLVFQVGAPGMIRGFDEGVRLLKEGSKARIYIPSVLAYGAQSPSPDIQPFSNLIFDIQVLKVSEQPLQQAQPQPGNY